MQGRPLATLFPGVPATEPGTAVEVFAGVPLEGVDIWLLPSPRRFQVAGRVVDPRAAPSSSRDRVRSARGPRRHVWTLTEPGGVFTLSGVPPGPVVLRARAEGAGRPARGPRLHGTGGRVGAGLRDRGCATGPRPRAVRDAGWSGPLPAACAAVARADDLRPSALYPPTSASARRGGGSRWPGAPASTTFVVRGRAAGLGVRRRAGASRGERAARPCGCTPARMVEDDPCRDWPGTGFSQLDPIEWGGAELALQCVRRVPRDSKPLPPWALFAAGVACAAPAAAQSDRWEKDITAFEAADRVTPPPAGEIVFVGSSTIRLWDLAAAFPDLKTINRGFGGSEMADSTRFVERIVVPLQPAHRRGLRRRQRHHGHAVGRDRDRSSSGSSRAVHAKLPDTRILYIGIKPSLLRWAQVDRMRAGQRHDPASSASATTAWASWTPTRRCWAGTRSRGRSSTSPTACTSRRSAIRS